MRVYLVRHAKAEKRRPGKADRWRPLSRAGRRQAEGLAVQLEGEPVARVVSSPARRCRETVAPLATRRGIAIEIDGRLAEGAGVEPALRLLRSLGDQPTVLCGHGDLIPALIEAAFPDSLVTEDGPRCEKGSVWVLDGGDDGSGRASYRTPTEAGSGGSDGGADRGADRHRARGTPGRVAVLDLGSTSFHLLVAERTSDGGLKRVKRERVMLRLGAELAQGPRIPDDVCARAVETAESLRRVAERAKADELVPVATAAVREAENGRELAARLGEALGTPVWILDGGQEARLIFASLRHRIPLEEPTLGLDLGGGSVELAVGDAAEVAWETTLALGVARLHGELVRSDPLTPGDAQALRDRVREALAGVAPEVAAHGPRRCAAVGGTVRALATLDLARRGESGELRGLRVSLDPLRELGDALARSSHSVRMRMPGIDSRRADLLPAGALILTTLIETLGYDGFTVCDWGLREGVILELVGA